MKQVILTISFLIIILGLSSAQADTIVQSYYENTRSTKEDILYKLRIVNDRAQLQTNLTVWLFQKELNQVYQGTTNDKGKVYFLIPNGKDYDLNFENDAQFKVVSLPPTPYLIRTSTVTYVSKKEDFKEWVKNDTIYQKIPLEQYATPNRALAKITLKNYSNEPLSEETIFFSVKNSKTVYAATTDKMGKATLMLPKAQTYSLNFKYYENVDSVTYVDDQEIYVLTVDYQYFGSKAIEQRERERELELIERDKLYVIKMDELKKHYAYIDSLNAITRINKATMDSLRSAYDLNYSIMAHFSFKQNKRRATKETLKIAEKTKAALEKNPKYFEQSGQAINAVLQRKKVAELWKNKMIVTDLTGSMMPYMDEILIWHALNATNDKSNQYLFFNDGKGSFRNGKQVGNGGGLFYTDIAEIDNILHTMSLTMQNGGGGDGPENDIEGLLGAMNMGKEFNTLILIADNYSLIKDKRLMGKLIQTQMPVRVILAGYNGFVHEDYLELAYKTGGSIHTLTEDIEDLYKLTDGELITIGGVRYRISKGRFLRQSSL